MTHPSKPEIDTALLLKEIETQGELFIQEKLERKAEIDRLRLELEALKVSIGNLIPDFREEFEKNYQDLLQNFDPETGRPAA
jgi:hypothetical protein